jgi:hypothetical protein
MSIKAGIWTLVAVIFGLWFMGKTVRPELPVQSPAAAKAAADQEAARAKDCVEVQVPRARELGLAGKHAEGVQLLDVCMAAAPNPTVSAARDALRADTEIAWLAANPKAPWMNRLAALRIVKNYAAAMPANLAPELERLEKRYDVESARERVQADAADRARRKKEGVVIGMSKDDVLASNWGKPKHVNTDISATSRREQWVYDGGYLYFREDTLTSIQTRNR